MNPPRGYKVTDADRKIRIGIAARTLEELKAKTIQKWNLNVKSEQFKFQLSDGTVVNSDEYLRTLEPQTCLVWVQNGKYADTDAEILYKTIREVNEHYLSAGEKVQQFFTEKMKSKVYKLAMILKNMENSRVQRSTKEEDPEWFEGLDTRSKSKEEYMFRRSQDRIRTFLYKTKEDLKKQQIPSAQMQELVVQLKMKLRSVDYYGCYFDRSKTEGKLRCLCDESGEFVCQGRWDKEACLYVPEHRINPYSSRQQRIVFQTWNLDHRIERARSLVPAIGRTLREWEKVKSATGEKDLGIVYNKVFRQLFTTDNLRLVHIVCHDKGRHATGEPKLIDLY